MKTAKGFTLIELLVVIAIIGILSSVVLASLKTARDKGTDATIISDIDGIRAQAEIYYGDNGNRYGSNSGIESECDPAVATDNLFSDSTIARQIAAATAVNSGGSVVCNVDDGGASYVVSVQLVADSTLYYCVDSSSVGQKNSFQITATDTHC